ncbi:MAG TPA: hypothetical protein VEB66_08900 [Opitutaceae bacterium]|nr:hypothetical protein [Opitutaceae bacterium]
MPAAPSLSAPAHAHAGRWRISVTQFLNWSPFVLALAGYCLHPINDLFRMLAGAPEWLVALGGHTTKLVFLPVIGLCALGVMRHRHLRTGRWPAAWFMLVALLMLLALLQGSWSVLAGRNSLRYYVSHLGMAGMMLCVTLHYALAGVAGRQWFLPATCRGIAAFCLGYFTLVYIVGFFFIRTGYWGINSAILLFPFSWYLLRRRWLATVLAAVLIVASGKRGTAVGMVAVLLAWFLVNYLASGGFRRLWRLALGLAVVALGVGSLVYLARSDPAALHPQLARAVAKWNELLPQNGEFSIDQASGGRASEIRGALNTMADSWVRIAAGSGYGWYFIWYEDPPPRPHHFTHVSPVNFVVTYGWVGGMAFLLLTAATMMACLWRVARLMRHRPAVVPAFLFLFAAGLLGLSCTSFTLGVDPMYWIVLGVLFKCVLSPSPFPPARPQ